MKIKLKYRKKNMDEKKTESEPSEPMMERSKRDLPSHKGLIIKLFYKSGDTEKEEEKSTDHPCPPDEIVSQKSRCDLSGHNLKV